MAYHLFSTKTLLSEPMLAGIQDLDEKVASPDQHFGKFKHRFVKEYVKS